MMHNASECGKTAAGRNLKVQTYPFAAKGKGKLDKLQNISGIDCFMLKFPCLCVCVEVGVHAYEPTVCDLMDCSLPDSSIYRIF